MPRLNAVFGGHICIFPQFIWDKCNLGSNYNGVSSAKGFGVARDSVIIHYQIPIGGCEEEKVMGILDDKQTTENYDSQRVGGDTSLSSSALGIV